MSTLEVNLAALRAAVAPFAVVREVRASPSFPHTLDVRVVEQLPVAALLAAGARTAVAADGIVLGPALLSAGLRPSARASARAPGSASREADVRDALTCSAPPRTRCAAQVAKALRGQAGLTLAMRNGCSSYFGDATRPHAKWRALEPVLADESSPGASYVDVRLPERPAAGGFPKARPPLAHTSAAKRTAAGSGPARALGRSARRSAARQLRRRQRRPRHGHRTLRRTAPRGAPRPAAKPPPAPGAGGEEAASRRPKPATTPAVEAAQTSGGATLRTRRLTPDSRLASSTD